MTVRDDNDLLRDGELPSDPEVGTVLISGTEADDTSAAETDGEDPSEAAGATTDEASASPSDEQGEDPGAHEDTDLVEPTTKAAVSLDVQAADEPDEPTIQGLIESVEVDTPPSQLTARLKPIFDRIAEQGLIEQESSARWISRRFKIGKRVVNALLKESRDRLRDRRNRERDAREAAATPGPPGARPRLDISALPVNDLPRVIVNGRQLRDVIREAWSALLRLERPDILCLHGGVLATLTAEAEDRPLRIKVMDEPLVYGILLEFANWAMIKDGKALNTFPRHDVSKTMLAIPDRRVPTIDAVVTAPVFAADGRLVTSPGFDSGTRTWLQLAPGFRLPSLQSNPSQEEVEAARALLRDFPFASDADRAHFLAVLLIPFARRMVDGPTPCTLIEAPSPGTGKGLLTDVLSVIATGAPAEGRTLPRAEDEVRKMITSELISGRPLVLIDNLSQWRTVSSSALAAVLTAETWTDRLLGKSQMLSLPNEATWILTGNNPSLSQELARRAIRVRLDASVDRPWLRDGFRHPNLGGWARKNRGRLVHAVLTLIQSWVAQGRPPWVGKRLGSYEGWSEVVGGILAAAEIPSFLEGLETFYATSDTESTDWDAFIHAWRHKFADKWLRVHDLADFADEEDLMAGVLGDGNHRSQATRLGKALSTNRDRVFGEVRIQFRIDGGSKRPMYRLEDLQPSPSDGSDA